MTEEESSIMKIRKTLSDLNVFSETKNIAYKQLQVELTDIYLSTDCCCFENQ